MGSTGFAWRFGLALSVAVAGWTRARPATACSCISPGFELITPAPGQSAPVNTRVRVAYVQSWDAAVTVVLRAEDGRQIPAEATTSASGEVRVVELVPERDLAASTRYEVRAIEPGPPRTETVVGEFVTGGDRDRMAPEWPGVRRAVIVEERPARAGRARRAAGLPVGGPSCFRSNRYAVLLAPPAADRDTPAPALLYAVWMPGPEGGWSPDQPPTAFVARERGRISLGSSNSCDPRQFSFPRRGTLRLGLAAVDPAGNLSPPVEVGLRLSRAARRAPHAQRAPRGRSQLAQKSP